MEISFNCAIDCASFCARGFPIFILFILTLIGCLNGLKSCVIGGFNTEKNVLNVENENVEIVNCDFNCDALTSITTNTTGATGVAINTANKFSPTGVGLRETNVFDNDLIAALPATTIATIVGNKKVNNLYGEPNGDYHYPCTGSPPMEATTTLNFDYLRYNLTAALTATITATITVTITVKTIANKNENIFYGAPNGDFDYPCTGSPPSVATTPEPTFNFSDINIELVEFNVTNEVFNVNENEINNGFDCNDTGMFFIFENCFFVRAFGE